MSLTLHAVLHPVTDLDAAKSVYSALLGRGPDQDAPYYVGYDVDGVQLGLVPGGAQTGMSQPQAQWRTDDLDATLTALTAAGATVRDEPRDVGGGVWVAVVRDGDGNEFGVISQERTR